MEKVLMLFRNSRMEEAAFQEMSPEAMQAEIEKWTNWLGSIAAQGKLIASEGLELSGRVMSTTQYIVTDGPYADAKEVVGGFLLMQNTNLDEATEFAKGCPSLETGGSVELRVIQKFD
jgi:hypothetical protein